MLLPRIIPYLLIHKGGLYKTVNFKNPKYVGDPLNAVKIFNEKYVDELVIIDIDATVENKIPNYTLIKNIASQCRMPVCYGGGIKTVQQIEKIIGLGVEKVAISSAAINNPNLILEASRRVGSQSIAVVLDIKKGKIFQDKYNVCINNGKKILKKNPKDLCVLFQRLGAGELIINSVDRDGTMSGYDSNLIDYFKSLISIPMTVVGGASSYENLQSTIEKNKLIGLGVGSLFVFKGKYRAVLIQYPNLLEKTKIFKTFLFKTTWFILYIIFYKKKFWRITVRKKYWFLEVLAC